ncbi:LysR family transcriptional regulator [Halomonas smyrnensis]|uniref:LysR family transcriptional regulator n=1 Tax=Halomonas smyrnensis TaxID=720605 RepID=UPI0003024E2C|nr:LysR substrate-binding domain-containing protein [Halomonas smyrnensis]
MAHPFDLDLYRTFVSVIDCAGFTSAASHLHRTQATISQQIKRLEDIMGRPLLVRTSRHLSLTTAGEALLPYARQMLQLHEQATAAVQGTKREPLRLGVPDDYAHTLLPAFLAVLSRETPHLTPVVHCDSSVALFERFSRGELDIIFTARYPNFPAGDQVSQEPLVWAGHPDFTLDITQPVPLALYPDGCPFRARALAALRYAERPWEVVYTGHSSSALHAPLVLGMGITVTSQRTLGADLRDLGHRLGLPPIREAALDLHVSVMLLERVGPALKDMLMAQANQALDPPATST